MTELVIATRNEDKKREIKKLLTGLNIKVNTLDAYPEIPPIKEDAATLTENAIKKALFVSRYAGALAIADDSGLEVKVLRGKPGVFSSRFAGQGATYKKNNLKLLRLLKDVPIRQRQAEFKCIIAIADNNKLMGVAEGSCKGTIGFSIKGRCGFGYDPIFIPKGHNKTFAQLGPKIKNRISHRAKALAKAKKIIQKYLQRHPLSSL